MLEPPEVIITKMEKAIKRVLATAEQTEAGVWRVSSDNIEILKEALKLGS